MRLVTSLLLTALCASSGSFAASVGSYLDKPAGWYKSPEARQIAENVFSWQCEDGDWPKNKDTVSAPNTGPSAVTSGTFDNGATTGELRFLAKMRAATGEERFKSAFVKGFQLILNAQYPNGGWPQSYPPGRGYPRHITFNDDTFVHLAELVREVAKSPDYNFIEQELRERASASFERAIDCVLRAQIKVGDKLTVWCAQHDEVTLEPRPARTYELVSLSGAESARLLRLLMSIEKPTPELRRAVEAGVKWFEKVKLTGIRQLRVNRERKIVQDETASPLWARFYEIGSSRPIFSGRDGVKRYSIDEIEAERRNGYAWYGEWGTPLIREYDNWRKKRAS